MSPAEPRFGGMIALPSRDDETYVYRAYCKCGDLLYVGIASNLFNRIAGHYRFGGSEWTHRAVRLEWEIYPTRAIAEAVEARLILKLDPSCNIQGRSRKHRRARWQDLPWPGFRDAGDTPEERFRTRVRAVSVGDRL